MFTGIVQSQGLVAAVRPIDGGLELEISAAELVSEIKPGDSVSVNGVCLTVTQPSSGSFTADVIPQTLRSTSLGDLEVGDLVNLELAVTPTSRLGGHIVQGHVDGVARLLERRADASFDVLRFELPVDIARYVVRRGSICVQGVALTVSDISDIWFEVSLIPTTWQQTTLGEMKIGQIANVEVDVLARHVERLLQVKHD